MVRYRRWRLDGSVDELHTAVDALQWDTVPEAVYQAIQRRHAEQRPGPLRLLVCGSRTWTDAALVAEAVEQTVAEHGQGRAGVVLIEGDARGADRLAGTLAKARGWELEVYPADWQRHGRSAGMRRNARMLREGRPERVIAFTDDLTCSRGTADMVRRARGAGIPVLVVSHPPMTREGGEAPGAHNAARQLPFV
jgi:YspA, cpYpsA-related SLOG family